MPKKTQKNRIEIYARYKIPERITIGIDSREQIPLLFPSTISIPHPEQLGRDLVIYITTIRTKLQYGDYRIEEFPDCCVVERKGSAEELNKNLLDPTDAIRQAKSFRKLASCEYPFLLIEASPESLWNKAKRIQDPQRLMAALSIAIVKYRLQVMWLPWKHKGPVARRQVGGLMAHLMLAHAIHKTLDILPDLLYDIEIEGNSSDE